MDAAIWLDRFVPTPSRSNITRRYIPFEAKTNREGVVMNTALKIGSDGTIEIIEYKAKNTLETLQAAVSSGHTPSYIEAIHGVAIGDLEFDMWVNEMGYLYGLEVNHIATRMTDSCFEHAPAVVGDIVLTGVASRKGDITSLSDRHANAILTFAAL